MAALQILCAERQRTGCSPADEQDLIERSFNLSLKFMDYGEKIKRIYH